MLLVGVLLFKLGGDGVLLRPGVPLPLVGEPLVPVCCTDGS